ncbi:hypothetical protein PINS_up012408 [Pythium insidiosum]|nr:hypothetical protein PINS_up012408 [Pythium insidiosum]
MDAEQRKETPPSTTTLALRCDDLRLPRDAKDKLWKQIGSLTDDDCRVVVQCQFVPETNERFRVGAMFLSVPLCD